MLLRELQNFEESVESVNKNVARGQEITWNNPTHVQSYIKSLNEATNILMRENSRLRKAHYQIMDLIAELSNHDLRKNRQTWLIKLEQIKTAIEGACGNK